MRRSQKLANVKFKCLREGLGAESRGSNSRVRLVRLVSREGEGIEGGRREEDASVPPEEESRG